jgi:hypothetical protein
MNCEWFWQVTWALTLFRHKLYHLFSALHPPSLPNIESEQINFERLIPTLTKYEYLETPMIEESIFRSLCESAGYLLDNQ